MTQAMFWSLHLRDGTVFAPTTAQTDAGYYLAIEPVKVARLYDGSAVEKAIEDTIGRGNPRVPTPTRAAFPKPVVLKHAKVRSWTDFEKSASTWHISEEDGGFEIRPCRRRDDGRGWEEDQSKAERLPELHATIRRLIDLMREADEADEA